MTSTFLRPAIALAIALSLAGCGGKASFPVNGTILGLSYPGLVLSTNGMTLPVNPPATTFSFPNSLSYGDVYEVTASAQPQHQTCSIPNGKDTAGRLAAINISVVCGLNQYTIGGSITGLKSTGLSLINGSSGGTVTAAAGATSFAFGTAVPYSVSYGVTVLTQPLTETCSVSQNGTGIMGDAAVNDIVVSCVPKPAA